MSDDALELVFDTLWGKLVEEETVCVSVKGVGFRWAKFPRWCISRETGFKSYVQPIELYQKVRVSVSVELIRSQVSGLKVETRHWANRRRIAENYTVGDG